MLLLGAETLDITGNNCTKIAAVVLLPQMKEDSVIPESMLCCTPAYQCSVSSTREEYRLFQECTMCVSSILKDPNSTS